MRKTPTATVGRPQRVTGEPTRMFCFRLTERERARLDAAAAARNITPAEYLRRAAKLSQG